MSLSLSHAQTCTGCGHGTRHPVTHSTRHKAEDTQSRELAMHCHVVSLSNAVQSLPLSLLIASVSMSGVAWRGWAAPPSKEELNMTECWQCNHVDHKAVPQTQTEGASKRRQATGCNVILQLVCSSAATCGICAAANRRIWLHTTKDHGQTAGGAGRKQVLSLTDCAQTAIIAHGHRWGLSLSDVCPFLSASGRASGRA